MNILSFQVSKIPDYVVARLLGLTYEEYHSLNHLPLEVDEGPGGETIGFRMPISSGNNPDLLAKLNCNKHLAVKFKRDAVTNVFTGSSKFQR